MCQNTTCATGRFLLDYRYLGRLPEGKHPRMGRRLNASGVRDTARGLRSSTDTVLRDRRQQAAARESMHTAFLRTHNPDDMAGAIARAGEEAEMDEWSSPHLEHYPHLECAFFRSVHDYCKIAL